MQYITVVGDLILDRYLIGDASNLNPEQPGIVIRADKDLSLESTIHIVDIAKLAGAERFMIATDSSL